MTQKKKVQTSNQITVDNETVALLLGNNLFIDGDVAASGADVEILEGLVMSRIRATGKIVPFTAAIVTSVQYIIGVAVPTISVIDGTTVSVRLVNGGRIAKSLINFADTSTLATSAGVTGGTLKRVDDILESLGLDLLDGEELTEVDNS